MAPTEGRVAKPEWQWSCRRGTPTLYALVLTEKKNVFKECPKLVVLWLVSHNSLGKEFQPSFYCLLGSTLRLD